MMIERLKITDIPTGSVARALIGTAPGLLGFTPTPWRSRTL